jgi:hypothetical protein
VKNGVPLDLAFRLDDVTRAAWAIIFGEFRGSVFDFTTMKFEEKS